MTSIGRQKISGRPALLDAENRSCNGCVGGELFECLSSSGGRQFTYRSLAWIM